MIIGGGLGGLCLAQGLTKSGISVTVYEADAAPEVRAQGYRISVKDTGTQALQACLPTHLFDLAWRAPCSRPPGWCSPTRS